MPLGEIVPSTILLTSLLMAIAVVDSRTQRIPNVLNLSLLLGGLGFQALARPELIPSQIVFAAAVVILFWTVRAAHKAASGIVGLGLGDVKMAGAGTIWISPTSFAIFLFVASFCALGFIMLTAATGGPPLSRSRRVAFGPFLALGIGIAFMVENFL